MIFGYAHVSTTDQDLAEQVEQLPAAGAAKVFSEKPSGKDTDRAQLKKAIAALDAGDVVLTPIDRLARSTRDPLNIFESGPEQVFDLWKYRALHGQPHKI